MSAEEFAHRFRQYIGQDRKALAYVRTALSDIVREGDFGSPSPNMEKSMAGHLTGILQDVLDTEENELPSRILDILPARVGGRRKTRKTKKSAKKTRKL